MSTINYDKHGPEVAAILRENDILRGSYFAKTRQVWGVSSATLSKSGENWNRFDRTRHSFDWKCLAMSRERKLLELYKSTRDHAQQEEHDIVSSKRSRKLNVFGHKSGHMEKRRCGEHPEQVGRGSPSSTGRQRNWPRGMVSGWSRHRGNRQVGQREDQVEGSERL